MEQKTAKIRRIEVTESAKVHSKKIRYGGDNTYDGAYTGLLFGHPIIGGMIGSAISEPDEYITRFKTGRGIILQSDKPHIFDKYIQDEAVTVEYIDTIRVVGDQKNLVKREFLSVRKGVPEAPLIQKVLEDRIEPDDPCFIATAVYGDPHAPQVETLRKIKDEVLMQNPLGKAGVRLYYSGAGKKTARFIQDHVPSSIPVIRKGLDAVVNAYNQKKVK